MRIIDADAELNLGGIEMYVGESASARLTLSFG